MSEQGAWQHTFQFGGGKAIVVEPSEAQLSSDAGLLPVRVFDERIGLTAQFAAALSDARCESLVAHPYLQMVRQRVYGILADYEDQNDHDALRSDPVFKLIAGHGPDGRDLASQPTLSRFENAITVQSLFRLQDVLIEQFIASFETPPARLTFDIDVWDDPTHGDQQLTFFHGYYDQYQYLPRTITCADNDQVVMVCLLFGTAHAALGAPQDLELLCERLRQAWPDVHIELRADSGFAVPAMYEMCEQLRVQYTFGLKMNPVLQRESEALLAQALTEYERTGIKQRLFHAFDYQAGSWPHARRTIIKCEAHAAGTNRRAVVTNRPGAEVLPAATYDEYAERGESENRNKELKCGLAGDRLSDHRYLANLFRLFLHTAAHNLLVRLRRLVADPPDPEPPCDLPTEALEGRRRKRYQNRRRERDPLGEGHPCTWRTRLIKVAAEVNVRWRCVRVRLSASWPFLDFFQRVSEAVTALPPLSLAPD
jgi:Transposase DDE domain group 1